MLLVADSLQACPFPDIGALRHAGPRSSSGPAYLLRFAMKCMAVCQLTHQACSRVLHIPKHSMWTAALSWGLQLHSRSTVLLQVCRKCKANKPAADFPQKRSHPDGRDDYCKGCHAKATAARVAARGPVKEPTVESKVYPLHTIEACTAP